MTASQTTSASYEVGYGKPPRHTQFKKGQSGNPGGRPRGRTRFQELVMREANRAVIVMEYGHAAPVPAIQAVLRSQFELAAAGNVRAQRAIVAMIQDIERETGQDLREPGNGDDGCNAGNDEGGNADGAGADGDAGADIGADSDPERSADAGSDTDDAPPVERWRLPPAPEPPPPPIVRWSDRPQRPGGFRSPRQRPESYRRQRDRR
jgi:hypothetical protein